MTRSLPVLDHGERPIAVPPPPAPEEALRSAILHDSHGRVIRDLRLSVTDRCNYRCVYCMAPDHRYIPKQQLLHVRDYLAVARVCRALGVEKVRVTGGEPTMFPQLDQLLVGLGELRFPDIAMTTNGSLMTEQSAHRWRKAGLKRITLSLDSLRDDRVSAITRSTATPQTVIDAIAVAKRVGLAPVKVNTVVKGDFNVDELPAFADFAREQEIDLRLIEFMPLDSGRKWTRDHVVSADEMIQRIGKRHKLVALAREDRHATSLRYGFADGSRGSIGVIASVTRAFCNECSRLRLTADGKVRPCLFSHEEWDLKPLVKAGASDEALAKFIIDSMWTKQAGHTIDSDSFIAPERGMSAIGG